MKTETERVFFKDELMRAWLEEAIAWGRWEPPAGTTIDDVVARQDWHQPMPETVPIAHHVTIMRRALGLDLPGRDRPSCNRAMTPAPRQDWEVLVKAGLATRERQPGRVVYRVTLQGARLALQDSETLDTATFGDLT
jgi:hypothetical protein